MKHVEVTIAMRVPDDNAAAAPVNMGRAITQLICQALADRAVTDVEITQVDGYDEVHAKLLYDAVCHYAQHVKKSAPQASDIRHKLAAIETQMRRRLAQVLRQAVNPSAATVIELELETGGSVFVRVAGAPNPMPIYRCKASGKGIRQQVCPDHVHQDAGDLMGYDEAGYKVEGISW